MDDQNNTLPAAVTSSEAERIMSAAGWRRERTGGNLECWRKDHDTSGEYALITADGDCDADPMATVWTCGHYRSEGAPNEFKGVACAQDPHHHTLARALEVVATLTVQDDEGEATTLFSDPAPKLSEVMGED